MDNKKGSDTAVSTSPIRHPVGEAGCEDKREVKPAGEGPQEAAVRAVDIDDWECVLGNVVGARVDLMARRETEARDGEERGRLMLHLTANGVDGSLATASLHAIGSPSDAIQSAVHVDVRGASIRLSVVRMGVDGVPSQVVEPTHRVSAAISLEITARVRALHDAAHSGLLTVAQAAAFLGTGDLPPIRRPPPPPPRLSEGLDYGRTEETSLAAKEFRDHMVEKNAKHRNRMTLVDARKKEMVKKGETPPPDAVLMEVIRREEWEREQLEREEREMEERMKNRTPEECEEWDAYKKWAKKEGKKELSDEAYFELKKRLAKAAEEKEKERAMEEVMEEAEVKEEEAMREKAKKRRAKEDGEEKEQNESMDTTEPATPRPVPLVATRRLSPPTDLPSDQKEHPGEETDIYDDDDSMEDFGPNELPSDEQSVHGLDHTCEGCPLYKRAKLEYDQLMKDSMGVECRAEAAEMDAYEVRQKLVESKERERAEREMADTRMEWTREVEEERDHMMEERDQARRDMVNQLELVVNTADQYEKERDAALDQLAQLRAAAAVMAPPPPAALAAVVVAVQSAVAPPPPAAAAAAAVVAAPINAALAADVAALRVRMADYLGGGGIESKMLGRGDKGIDKQWHRITAICGNRLKRLRAAVESALPRLSQALIADRSKHRILKAFVTKTNKFLDTFDGLVELGEIFAKVVVNAYDAQAARPRRKVDWVQATHGVAFSDFDAKAKTDLPALRAFEKLCCSLPIPL